LDIKGDFPLVGCAKNILAGNNGAEMGFGHPQASAKKNNQEAIQ
jgi:hypothetical protein